MKWRYVVPLKNAATGEQHMIVVELSEDERADALEKIAPVGGPHGLIVCGYAFSRASKIAPAGFEPAIDRLEFVTVH